MYSVIYDKDCVVLSEAENSNPKVISYVQSTPIEQSILSSLEKKRSQKELYSISGIGEVLEFLTPILSRESLDSPNTLLYKRNLPSEEKLIGVVRVGFSLERVNYQIKKMVSIIVIITIIVIFVLIAMSPFLVKILITSNKNLQ